MIPLQQYADRAPFFGFVRTPSAPRYLKQFSQSVRATLTMFVLERERDIPKFFLLAATKRHWLLEVRSG